MKEETTYRKIEFSIEKAKIEGNKVVLRGDHSFEPEWHYFKNCEEDEYPICYIDSKGIRSWVDESGFYEKNVQRVDDLIILEPIKETVMYANIFLKEEILDLFVNLNDAKNTLCNLRCKITFENNEPISIEKL